MLMLIMYRAVHIRLSARDHAGSFENDVLYYNALEQKKKNYDEANAYYAITKSNKNRDLCKRIDTYGDSCSCYNNERLW